MKTSTSFLTAAVLSTAFWLPAVRADVLLSEVYYDNQASDDGLEWVELVNTGTSSVDLAGWSLGWGGTDYTFGVLQLSGVVLPGEAFVVGGTISDASNGNPVYDLGVDFDPDIQNSGVIADGLALFNVPAASVTAATVPVDAVIYGTSNDNLLMDETGAAGAVDVGDAPSGSTLERTEVGGTWTVQPNPTPGVAGFDQPTTLIITEVFYDMPSGSDDEYEWVELVNVGSESVNLSSWCLGWGGTDYTFGVQQLSGTIEPGEVFVVGGTLSESGNGSPSFDLAVNLEPDIQNSGVIADGVALFNVPAISLTAATVPIDAVIYGTSNDNGLLDETGAAGAVDVGDAPSGQSLERVDLAGAWQIQMGPNPGVSIFGAEPSPILGIELLSFDSVSGEVELEIEMAAAATIEVESSGTLLSNSWDSEGTTSLGVGRSVVPITLSPIPSERFFRAREVAGP